MQQLPRILSGRVVAPFVQRSNTRGSLVTSRYLRLYVTRIATSLTTTLPLYSWRPSADGGSTFVPSSAMSNNTTPSPLVASDVASSANAWRVFDQNNTTVDQPASPEFTNGVPPTDWWVQIDLGAGNGIAPNAMQAAMFNSAGFDCSLVDFRIDGSNTGAFSGEQITHKSWTGQASGQTHQALVTFT